MSYRAGRGFSDKAASPYGFARFWNGRPEMSGTLDYSHEWRVHSRPGTQEGHGPLDASFSETRQALDDSKRHRAARRADRRSGRGAPDRRVGTQFSEPGGVSNLRPMSNLSNLRPKPQVPTAQAALGARSSYDLTNVHMVAGAIGSPTGGMVRREGAAPRGTQFNSVGGPPRPFGELGPAGSSSITTKTETKGKRAGQMAWDF